VPGEAPVIGGPEWTDGQRYAIARRDGELFLDAAAGSGKTSVLVERFVRAVLEDGIGVDRILTITFTEKAAAEMRERIRLRLLELGAREHARAVETAYISTIHAFCARLLRTHALAAGIDPVFVVLDEWRAAHLARRAFDDALERLAQTGQQAERLIASYRVIELRSAIQSSYGQLRSRGERHPRLPAIVPAPELAPLLERTRAAAARALGELRREDDRSQRVLTAIERLERAAALRPAGVPWPGDLRALGLPGGNGAALRTEACLAYTIALDELRDACAHHLAADLREPLDRLLRAYGARYEQRKRARSGLDFDDLELLCGELLRSDPELCERYRERFERVMVDELQDTNAVQLELIELLARGNLFTVGDAQQSIYAFRHADVTLFERRGERLGAAGARATLQVNFRSRPEIVQVINRAFGPLLGARFLPLKAGRPEDPEAEPRVELLVVDRGADSEAHPSAVDWRAAEAELLADRVHRLLDAGSSPAEVVVLVRATTDIRVYEQALERRGVPTFVVGGRGYWSHPQVVDMVAYLRVLANPRDEEALYTVLVSPLVGVSYDALVLVAAAARERGWDPWSLLRHTADAAAGDPPSKTAPADPSPPAADAAGGGGPPTELGADDRSLPAELGADERCLPAELGADDRSRILTFVRWLVQERQMAGGRGIQELIERALDRTGYELAVMAQPGGARRLANIRKLMRLGREHDATSGPDLRGFLDLVAERSRSGEGEEGEAPIGSEALQAVRLMTIHRAKGLEFPVVCVADLGRSPRRESKLLRVSADGRLGLRLAQPGSGAREPALAYEPLGEEQRRARDAEERRLFYVAATRARERLIFSGVADVASVWGGKAGAAPIGWLGPALIPGLTGGSASGEAHGVRFRIVSGARAEGGSEPRPSGPEPRPASGIAAEPTEPLPPGAAAVTPGLGAAVTPGPGAATVTPGAAARAAMTPPPPARPTLGPLSYTGLALFARCPYRFYVERVLGLPPLQPGERFERDDVGAAGEVGGDAGAAGIGAVERGTIVHTLLEQLDFSRPRAPSPAAVAAVAGRALSERECVEMAQLIAGFVSGQLCARLGRARAVRREQPFRFLLGQTLITGVFDVLAHEHSRPSRGLGRALVVDYKTDQLNGASPEEVVRASYREQRLIYALAALRDGAEEVEVAHVFLLRPDRPAVARYTSEDAAALERELAQQVERVQAGVFPVSDRPHRGLCAGCPAEGGLCSWPVAVTRRPSPDWGGREPPDAWLRESPGRRR
jgi:ATP-dependent helicase/nuclease subunit A